MWQGFGCIGGCGVVLVDVASLLSFAAARRHMMKRPAEHCVAESMPIVLRVRKVQVPGFVDLFGGRDTVLGDRRQENETLVLLHNAKGEAGGPAVFAREAGGKFELRARLVDIERLDSAPEICILLVHRCLAKEKACRSRRGIRRHGRRGTIIAWARRKETLAKPVAPECLSEAGGC
jgi:hypothetical protein